MINEQEKMSESFPSKTVTTLLAPLVMSGALAAQEGASVDSGSFDSDPVGHTLVVEKDSNTTTGSEYGDFLLGASMTNEDMVSQAIETLGRDIIESDLNQVMQNLAEDRDYIAQYAPLVLSDNVYDLEDEVIIRFLIATLRTKVLFDASRYDHSHASLGEVFEDATFDQRIREDDNLHLTVDPAFWPHFTTILDIYAHKMRQADTGDTNSGSHVTDILFIHDTSNLIKQYQKLQEEEK